MSDKPESQDKTDGPAPKRQEAPPPSKEEGATIVDRHRTGRPVEDLGGEID